LETLKKLIEIYARQPADQVTGDPEFAELYAEHPKVDDPFHAQHQRVKKIKRRLEKEVGIQGSPHSQVKFALRYFHGLLGGTNDEDRICVGLTKLAYYPNWISEQKTYFDETCTRMRTKVDYFLSFTQRNRSGAGNPINGYHRHLIQVVGQLADPLMSVDNQFAKMLDNLLKRKFTGFFFPTTEGESNVVKKNLAERMSQSLVFIQLVQNEMFVKAYAGQPNFCHEEYLQAIAENKKVILLFADGEYRQDLLPDFDVLPDLDEWYEYVFERDALFMKSTQFAPDPATMQENHLRLKEKVMDKVEEFRVALWENAPADPD